MRLEVRVEGLNSRNTSKECQYKLLLLGLFLNAGCLASKIIKPKDKTSKKRTRLTFKIHLFELVQYYRGIALTRMDELRHYTGFAEVLLISYS